MAAAVNQVKRSDERPCRLLAELLEVRDGQVNIPLAATDLGDDPRDCLSRSGGDDGLGSFDFVEQLANMAF